MIKEEKHTHQYKKVELLKITPIDNILYSGTPGDKSFLIRRCSCGKAEAFDYGRTSEMEEKLKSLESSTK